jgi:acyl carrier protein
MNTMAADSSFTARTPDQIKADLLGYPPSCVDAALRFRATGQADALFEMLPGMIEFHLPTGTPKPPAILQNELRLNQDLGLDSLALTEMAFVMSELFAIPVETREMVGIQTVGDLKAFLRSKLQA